MQKQLGGRDIKSILQSSSLKLFLALEFVALIIVSYQVRVDNRLSLLEKTGLLLFSPFQSLAASTSEHVSSFFDKKKTHSEMKSELSSLQKAVKEQKLLVYKLEEMERENRRLRGLLNLPERSDWKMEYAEVIGRSKRYGDFVFLINKGSYHGLVEDRGVICGKGVVGILWQVGPFSSKVLTLRSQGAVVAAMTKGSNYMDAYSAGLGESYGSLQNVPNFEQVQKGEEVLTSGMDTLFPKGLPIGVIVEMKKTTEMFQDILVKFEVDFSRLEEVVILLPPEQKVETP